MNPNVELTQKLVYSSLDFFRDIGGAAFLLFLVSGNINALWTYNKLENSIAAELYKKPSIIKGEVDKIGEDKELRPDN